MSHVALSVSRYVIPLGITINLVFSCWTIYLNSISVMMQIRRQSTIELKTFKERWEKAAKEDKTWVDPYRKRKPRRSHKSDSSEV